LPRAKQARGSGVTVAAASSDGGPTGGRGPPTFLEFSVINFSVCSSFPQLLKLLILFLTIPVTVATAERSFSKLKIIKSYLPSSMSQERLDEMDLPC